MRCDPELYAIYLSKLDPSMTPPEQLAYDDYLSSNPTPENQAIIDRAILEAAMEWAS
jgi:hypothetical protein